MKPLDEKLEDMYQCRLCEQYCDNMAQWERHITEYHGSTMLKYTCPSCQYICHSRLDMDKHIEYHRQQHGVILNRDDITASNKDEFLRIVIGSRRGKSDFAGDVKKTSFTERDKQAKVGYTKEENDMAILPEEKVKSVSQSFSTVGRRQSHPPPSYSEALANKKEQLGISQNL